MDRDVYPFSSPSTISSTPNWASTLAMELQPYSSTGGTPFPTQKEVETVKRQVLQTTPPSRMGAQQETMTPGMEGVQSLAATPQEVEGAQQVATTPRGVEGVQPLATTPRGVEGAQQVATTPQGVEGAQQVATTPRGVEGVQPLAATPQGVEGAQQVATTPRGVEGAQQVATTPQGVEGAQPLAATPLSGSGDHKRKAEEGQEQRKSEKMETIQEEEEDGVKLVPLHRPEEEDIEEILKYV